MPLRRSLFIALLVLPCCLAALALADSSTDAPARPPLNQESLPPHALWLEDLDLKHMRGVFQIRRTLSEKPLKLNGVEYPHGIGCGDIGILRVDLKRAATRFEADFNLDDSITRKVPARAYVFVDGKLVYQSDTAAEPKLSREPYRISVDLTDASELVLVGITPQSPAWAAYQVSWGGARLLLDPAAKESPETAPLPEELLRNSYSKKHHLLLDDIYHAFYTSSDGLARFGRTEPGTPIILSDGIHSRGVVLRPRGYLKVDLKGGAEKFSSIVGVTIESPGSVVFRVTVDEKVAFDSGPMSADDAVQQIDVDLRGANILELTVDGATRDSESLVANAVWAQGRIDFDRNAPGDQGVPEPRLPDQVPMPIAPIKDGPEPAIHGPIVTGASPGHPFIFQVPASGEKPLTYSADGLPTGLEIDSTTGIITGTMAEPLEQLVTVRVSNSHGEDSRFLTIACAPYAMSLTPPLGWSSWNQFGLDIDEKKIKAAADALVSKGFAAHGFVYVNIDDGWEGERLPDGTITSKSETFPDMKALGEYIHNKGLKFGIYSSPGPTTCGGCVGSYGHEAQDANTWASWGVDYLKYDGCSGNRLPDIAQRYRLMRQCLDATGRDVVYSTNSTRDPLAHAQLWRTTPDIQNRWQQVNQFGFIQPVGTEKIAGPGRYNDPDMLVVGRPEWLTTRRKGPLAEVLSLTHNEQVAHITQWSMLAAPLLLGCDITDADEFLVSLMCNDDVLAINQDPLVRQARRLRMDPPVDGGGGEVWVRPLFDGTTAVALYNRNAKPIRMSVTWDEIGRTGDQPVRNCWLRKDLGTIAEGYEAQIETHGAVLLKVGRPETDRYLTDAGADQ